MLRASPPLIIFAALVSMVSCHPTPKREATSRTPHPFVEANPNAVQATLEVFQGPVKAHHPPGEILEQASAAISELDLAVSTLLAIPVENLTFYNTWETFDSAVSTFREVRQLIHLVASVHPEKATQADAVVAQTQLDHALDELFFRQDLYTRLKSQAGRLPIHKRLIGKLLPFFERNGLATGDSATIVQVKALQRELTDVEAQYVENLNQDKTQIEFTDEELVGVPEEILSRLEKTPDSARFIVPLTQANFQIVMQNAFRSETRKRLLLAHLSRQASTNVSLFNRAIELRRQIAQKVGKKNWAQLRIESQSSTDMNQVTSFLDQLVADLGPSFRMELGQLLDFKRTFDPSARAVDPWDIRFLEYQLKKTRLQLDDEEIREYFPANQVIKNMMTIVGQLLGIRFVRLTQSLAWSSNVEEPNVQVYEVREAHSPKVLGHFYTDLQPRPGKVDLFSVFPITTSRRTTNGMNTPTAALVANFSPPTADKPTLLTHAEVETLFHEFGHLLHHLLSSVTFGSLSGSAVSRDFLDVPAKLLENWAWDADVLKRISGHYRDRNQRLPRELIDRMIGARKTLPATNTMIQAFLSRLDLAFHTAEKPQDNRQVFHQVYENTLGLGSLEEAQSLATLTQFMDGHDAARYADSWSQMYADDLFDTLFGGQPLIGPGGKELKKHLFGEGDTRAGDTICRGLLRRNPNAKAFLNKRRGSNTQ